MDALECIMTRRTIRKFMDSPVADKDLREIIKAVRMAPSWANTQCVSLVVIKDPEIKKALQGTLPQGNPARNGVVEAPCVIALCAKKGLSGYYNGEPATPFGDWFLFDAGIACQNLALAAHAMGYGIVNVGLMDQEAASSIIKLPEEMVCLELLPLGRPAKIPEKAPERKPVGELVYENRFGETLWSS